MAHSTGNTCARIHRLRMLLAAVAMLGVAPVSEAAGSAQAIAVGARIITSCRMGSAALAAPVTVRCTGEVALQAGAGMPGGATGGGLQVVQGVHRDPAHVSHTVLEASYVGDAAGESHPSVTVMF